jgi:hypothetical protein
VERTKGWTIYEHKQSVEAVEVNRYTEPFNTIAPTMDCSLSAVWNIFLWQTQIEEVKLEGSLLFVYRATCSRIIHLDAFFFHF